MKDNNNKDDLVVGRINFSSNDISNIGKQLTEVTQKEDTIVTIATDKPKHLMIDVECLSKTTDAVILSIGAVAFNMNGTTGAEFEKFVDVNSQIKAGASVEWSTIQWWFNQEETARKQQADATRFPLKDCLVELTQFCKDNLDPKFYAWSNGASFDLAMLNYVYAKFNMPTPYTYKKQLDCRTISWLAKLSTKNYSDETDIKHSAVSDCHFQIRFVVDGHKILKDY